ncbi:MAG: DnaJ domain-containing protein [Gammaproteobacteria bacterium]|nr:DnaJ domain-containing protein [Gammaproteobacteria bacterium]
MRMLIIIAAIVIIVMILLNWFTRTSAKEVAQTLRKSALLFVIGIVILLALTGRLHWLFAAISAMIAILLPLMKRFLPMLLMNLPLLRRLFNRHKAKNQTGQQFNQTRAGTHSIDEAYKTLGLTPGASKKEIVTAHKRLMQKFHPDRGGSTHLATQINQAKDFLLNQNKDRK